MQDNIALFISALLVVLISAKILFISKKFILYKILFLIIVFVISLCMPIFKGVSLAYLIRGLTDDLSISTGIVVIFRLFSIILQNKKIDPLDSKTLSWIIFIIGMVIYISNFGYTSFDIYDHGYISVGNNLYYFLFIYILLQTIFWFCNQIFAWIWLIALLGFIFQLQYSTNVFDYLFDPIIWIISILNLMVIPFRSNKNKFILCSKYLIKQN